MARVIERLLRLHPGDIKRGGQARKVVAFAKQMHMGLKPQRADALREKIIPRINPRSREHKMRLRHRGAHGATDAPRTSGRVRRADEEAV